MSLRCWVLGIATRRLSDSASLKVPSHPLPTDPFTDVGEEHGNYGWTLMAVCGTNGSILCFVFQDDYIPYPSIEEVGAPLLGSLPGEIMAFPSPAWEKGSWPIRLEGPSCLCLYVRSFSEV